MHRIQLKQNVICGHCHGHWGLERAEQVELDAIAMVCNADYLERDLQPLEYFEFQAGLTALLITI